MEPYYEEAMTETQELAMRQNPKPDAFTRDDEWGGFSVHATRTGWIVRGWSRVAGCTSHWMHLLPYCPDYPKGTDLRLAQAPSLCVGDILAQTARCADHPLVRVMQHGHVVA